MASNLNPITTSSRLTPNAPILRVFNCRSTSTAPAMEILIACLPATTIPAFAINRRFSCFNGANALAFDNFTASSRRWTQSTFTYPAGFSQFGTRLIRRCQSGDAFNVCKRMKRLQFQKNKDVMAIINVNSGDGGAQKEEFVEQLCVELERRRRFAFYDKRSRSLPKGEKFPEVLKLAVKQCQMMVVVVSEEYFKSKWPMIELHAFVQVRKRNPETRILPLFFGLSVEEFHDSARREGWFKEWNTFAKSDPERIKVDEWKGALKLVSPHNGIVYNQGSKEVVAYRNEVVSQICSIIPADIKLEDSHVQGRSDLCKVILENFEKLSPERSNLRMMGLYGVGGIGKTTMCKTLCNELDGVFNAKVFHVELLNGSEVGKVLHVELLQKALNALTNTSLEFAKDLNEDQCRDILWKKNSWKQKTFLAVDNVWDDESFKQARMYLKAPFHEGSMVIVTSRFLKTLTSLGIHENACFEMPELRKDDAKKLFLYYASDGKQFESEEDVSAIEECISNCYFSKGGNQGSHYHPLALRVLGVQLHHIGDKRPSEWVKSLSRIRGSSHLQGPRNPLFSILRSNFDRLPLKEQDLFMDLCIYFPSENRNFMTRIVIWVDLMEWLCLVHNEDIEKINEGLQHLKESAVLEDVDMSSGRGRVSMHDLYREFAKLESEGRLDESINLEKRRWLNVTSANFMLLDETPGGRCWQNLKRVCISENIMASDIPNLEEIKWEYFANLVILKLDGRFHVQGGLNFKGLRCLRSLDFQPYSDSMIDVEGLEGLKVLSFIKMDCRNIMMTTPSHVGQLPASLKVLDVFGKYVLRQDVLELCTKLRRLNLVFNHAHGLDLRNCTSLEELQLLGVTGFMSTLDLVEVPGFDPLNVDLKAKLTKLPDLNNLRRLRELKCHHMGVSEAPNLSGLEQLQVVELHCNSQLTSLEGLRDLPALRWLKISGCPLLRRLPDLSKSTKLEELLLPSTGIELREEDICMLANLPLLLPVLVGSKWRFRLDLPRRKILWSRLRYEMVWLKWKRLGWEEKDLGIPPIKLNDIENIWNRNPGQAITRIAGDHGGEYHQT